MAKYVLPLVFLQLILIKDIICCSCGCDKPDNSPSDFSSDFAPPLSPLPALPSYDPAPSKLYNEDYIPSVRIQKPICYSPPSPPPPPPPRIPPPSVCKELGILSPSFFAPPTSSCHYNRGSLLPILRRKVRPPPCLPKPSCISQKLASLLNMQNCGGLGLGSSLGFNLTPLSAVRNYGCGCRR
ncbi:leucine-rich repeat extensin-like protein 1 [Tribolium madens]|uniref:leucine-rich repeat extensin-like protein 1 n=1 Tax=Tribolium madens TaxID=41895 RepID=UPI001CF72603|nr:leucine-rich repeat extensin-like protein 1 [Tribolium madens]